MPATTAIAKTSEVEFSLEAYTALTEQADANTQDSFQGKLRVEDLQRITTAKGSVGIGTGFFNLGDDHALIYGTDTIQSPKNLHAVLVGERFSQRKLFDAVKGRMQVNKPDKGAPPWCQSTDNVTGYLSTVPVTPPFARFNGKMLSATTASCESCPYAEFMSETKCRPYHYIFLLLIDNLYTPRTILPSVLEVSVTSRTTLRAYMKSLAGDYTKALRIWTNTPKHRQGEKPIQTSPWDVVTKLTVDTVKKGTESVYELVQFKAETNPFHTFNMDLYTAMNTYQAWFNRVLQPNTPPWHEGTTATSPGMTDEQFENEKPPLETSAPNTPEAAADYAF